MKILVTGMAGFIGFHLAKHLAKSGYQIVGLDNINDYYTPQLKIDRLADLGFQTSIEYGKLINSKQPSPFRFIRLNVEDKKQVDTLFETEQFDYVIHLAAQAGVRYSLQEPYAYINSNITGFLNILEACRHNPVKHLIYASSSSVYGLNQTIPFSEKHPVNHPASLYAATKKSNELMAHTYSYLYNIPTTGLRFFTVYGPWGRPDMAYFSFTEKILKGEPIVLFNYGNMRRDFTYVDDIVEGILRLIPKVPAANETTLGKLMDNPDQSIAQYRIYNIGNNNPVPLEEFVSALENALEHKAIKQYQPLQPGDVIETYANVDNLMADVGFRPSTDISVGLKKFVQWYKGYYKV